MSTSAAVTLPPAIGVRRPTAIVAWINLVGQIVIIFTGGLVRLTGSGLGCSTWPQCEPGSFTPAFHEASSIHPFIEFGNRTLTGVLAAIGIALAWLVWREKNRSRNFKLLGLVPLLGVVVQAVVGGLSVWTKLDPTLVGFHLLLSVGLVWASALIVVRCREGDGPAEVLVSRGARNLGWALALVFVPLAVLGVVTTGSGPHSGDDVHGYRFAIDPAMAARLHAAVVWVFVILLIIYLVQLRRTHAPASTLRAAWWLVGAVIVQGAIGYLQFALGLPVPLVALHLLGVALVTAAVTFAVLAQRRRGALVSGGVA